MQEFDTLGNFKPQAHTAEELAQYELAFGVFKRLMNVPHLRQAALVDFAKPADEITLNDMMETLSPDAVQHLIEYGEQTERRSVRLSVKRRERWNHGGRP